MRPLILVGGGGHCKSVIEVAESAGYTILGILDRPEERGRKVLGYEVLGVDDDIAKFVERADFIITVGQIKSTELRIKLYNLVRCAGGHFATIIAPTAHVSKYAQIGEGTVVMHHAMVNSDAIIGDGCIINTFANIEHEVVVGDFCHISTGVMINGEAIIGEGCFIGSQSVVNQCVNICPRCVIGSGSVVSRNLNHSGVYQGNPLITRHP